MALYFSPRTRVLNRLPGIPAESPHMVQFRTRQQRSCKLKQIGLSRQNYQIASRAQLLGGKFSQLLVALKMSSSRRTGQ